MTPVSVLWARWTAVRRAVDRQTWAEAEPLALELASAIEEIVTARNAHGPMRDLAAVYRRDGLYRIGWQRFMFAPESTRAALQRLNAAIVGLPAT